MDESANSNEMLAVSTKLPKELGKKFLDECERTDRDMSSMARNIIRLHFQRQEEQMELEKLRLAQREKSPGVRHFGEYEQSQENLKEGS